MSMLAKTSEMHSSRACVPTYTYDLRNRKIANPHLTARGGSPQKAHIGVFENNQPKMHQVKKSELVEVHIACEVIYAQDAHQPLYLYLYDGNGNVTNIVNAGTNTIVNSYDYGPFGEVLKSVETVENPFRFSTKYRDDETGLLYYGYRYLNVDTGRWLNRDPIQETGGKNIYAFVNNDAVNGVDYLGLNKQPFSVKKTINYIVDPPFSLSQGYDAISKSEVKKKYSNRTFKIFVTVIVPNKFSKELNGDWGVNAYHELYRDSGETTKSKKEARDFAINYHDENKAHPGSLFSSKGPRAEKSYPNIPAWKINRSLDWATHRRPKHDFFYRHAIAIRMDKCPKLENTHLKIEFLWSYRKKDGTTGSGTSTVTYKLYDGEGK